MRWWAMLAFAGCMTAEAEMPDSPVVTSKAELAAHDGQVVRIEGVYAKRMSQKKMNDPTLYFFGFVDLEVDGGRVQLGVTRRGDDEVDAFAGKRVTVTGTLVLDRGAGLEYARPDPRPTLMDISELALAE